MTKEKYLNLSTKSHQRYYTCFLLTKIDSFLLKSIWKDSFWEENCQLQYQSLKTKTFDNFEIIHAIYHSNVLHLNGYNKDNSVHQNSEPPFQIDCFAFKSKLLNLNGFLFPLRIIATNFSQNLITQHGFLNKHRFLKPELNNIVRVITKDDVIDKGFRSNITGVSIGKKSSSNLSHVTLTGRRPFKSDLGKLLFEMVGSLKGVEENQETDIWSLKMVRNKVEMDTPLAIDINRKSSLEQDSYGNIKMYLHKNAANLYPFIKYISILNSLNLLSQTEINPVSRL